MLDLSRRSFLGLGSTVLLAACGGRAASAPRDAADPQRADSLPPTPHIADEDSLPPLPAAAGPAACTGRPTAENIEGPFYKAGAPHRAVLLKATDPGERLVIAGTLRTTRCEPIANATIDVWQANAEGVYDLDGYRFRGALATDAAGRWELHTVVPGRYLNGNRYRPAHVHVKVSAPGHALLTTQLYFPDDPYNDGDPFIDDALIMTQVVGEGTRFARFDFVLA